MAACQLTSKQQAVTPESLYAWTVANVPPTAEAVVIGGNGFRAVGVIAALEQQLGCPVLTANQVLFWALLRAASYDTKRIRDYGAIFRVA